MDEREEKSQQFCLCSDVTFKDFRYKNLGGSGESSLQWTPMLWGRELSMIKTNDLLYQF